MPIVPINGRSIVTPLWYVAIKLRAVADKFHDMYDDINGAWLVGPYFAWPFWFIWYQLHLAADYTIDAETMIAQMKIWLDGLVEGTAFRDILFWISGNFRDITVDAVSFVMNRFGQISGEMSQFVNYPFSWFYDKVVQTIPGIIDVSRDPLGWVYDQVSWLFSEGIHFLNNPRHTLRNWIHDLFWWFGQFNVNPRQSIVDWFFDIYPWLRILLISPSMEIARMFIDFYPDMSTFVINPTSWVSSFLEDLFGVSRWQLRNPGVLFIDKILDIILYKKQRYEGRIRRIITEVILWFI